MSRRPLGARAHVPAARTTLPSRRKTALAAVIALVVAPFVALATPAAAETGQRPFAPVFSRNTNGSILLAANTLMTCQTPISSSYSCNTALQATTGDKAKGVDASVNNNGYYSKFVDVDGDGTTFNSSSAELLIPDGGSVLYALLSWGGRTPLPTDAEVPNADPDLRGTARLTGPDGAHPIVATQVDWFNDGKYGVAYQSSLDVTELVQRAGSGTYTMANVQSETGDTNNYAGWSLVVVVSDPAAPKRNLTVFSGFTSVNSYARDQTITVSGFVTPPTGDVITTLGAVSYEGDMGQWGDSFLLNGTAITNGLNDADNVFNSTVSRLGAQVSERTPSYNNQLGFDADLFAVPVGTVPNGATSAEIGLTTSDADYAEQYFPGVVTFETLLFDPKLTGTKDVTDHLDLDLDGVVGPGDVLRYTILVENIGLDTAVQSTFFDAIPTGTTYVPGSMTLDGVSQTDEPDNDLAQYIATDGGHVLVYLGEGATPTEGGEVPRTSGTPQHTVTYSVKVNGDVTNEQEITNAAVLVYSGLTTGAAASSTTNAVVSPVVTDPIAGNGPPTATPHIVTLEPTPTVPDIAIDVLADDTDPEGDDLTVVDVTSAAGGSVTINEDGTVTYEPYDDFAGRDVFTYTIEDTAKNRSTATVQVEVVNIVPVAGSDSATTFIDTSVTLDVTGNDTDANGDPLAVRSVDATSAQGGTVALVGGQVVYSPPPGYPVTDTFTYVVEDSRGATDTATVTITVENGLPVAVDDDYVTDEGVPVSVGLLDNDSDLNGDDLAVRSIDTVTAKGGSVTLVAGAAVYTPPAGFVGTDTFTYTIEDEHGATDTATVTVLVNGAPVAVDDDAPVDPGEDVNVDVLDNDSDPNGDTLTVTVAGPPHGSAVVETDGTITYTPDAGWAGEDTFTYTVSDGRLTDTATVTVTVANTPPTAGDDGATTAPGTPVTVDVLDNDSDPNVTAGVPGQALSVTGAVVNGAGATATVNPDGTITVDPVPGFEDIVVTITYTLSDGAGGTATGTLTVTVDNAAPVAVDDAVSTPKNVPVTVDVLGNDTDANIPGSGQVLDVVGVAADNGATATVNPDGTLTVTPAPGFVGDITVTYTVSDGLASDTGTLTVTVDNAAPVAVDDAVSTPKNTAVVVDVLDGDTDANGDSLMVTGVTPPANGSVVDNGDGTVTYTPNPGYAGSDSFTYTITDGTETDTATVTVTVLNAAPVAVDDAATTASGTPVDVDVLANDTDANIPGTTQVLSVVGVAADSGATVTNVGGVLTVTPAAGFKGDITVTYTVSDGAGGSDTGVLTVTVGNAAPVAVDDTATTPHSTPVSIPVLANDTDANPADTLTVVVGSLTTPVDGTSTTRGSVALVGGSVVHTPQSGFTGEVTFEYTVTDGTATDTATVTVTVTNGVPVAVDDAVSTKSETPVRIDVVQNDSDPEGGQLTVLAVTQPPHGTATIVDGAVVYTPTAGFTGRDTFTYTVADPDGGRTTAVVTVDVAAAPGVPGGRDSGVGGWLPRTGIEAGQLLGIAALLVAAGAVLTLVVRRRRRPSVG